MPKAKNYDSIAQRLTLILTKFNNGECFTVNELATEFNVSLRTIQRDLNDRLSYLPIEKHKDFYSLAAYALGKLNFDDIKNFACLSGVKALYPNLSDQFITDLLNDKINQAYLIKHLGFENLSTKNEYFKQLSLAIIKKQVLNLHYNDKLRTVKPYKLVNNNNIWYLVADENQQLKHYSLSKIKQLKLLDEQFNLNQDFIKIINDNKLKWFSQASIKVKLAIKQEVANYFLRRSLLANQQIIDQDDQQLIISTEVAFEQELLGTVQYWLPHISILEPQYLQENLEKMLKNYLSDTSCRKQVLE